MAVVTIGGVVVSTYLLHNVIPAVYTTMDRLSMHKYAVSEAEVTPNRLIRM